MRKSRKLKPEEQKHKNLIRFLLTDDDKSKLQYLMVKNSLSLSKILRKLITEKYEFESSAEYKS